MRSGKIAWKLDTPGGRWPSSPAIFADPLVVHRMDGLRSRARPLNGKLLWRYTIGSPIESSPVVHDGVDYFGDWNGRVYALDLTTKRFRWVRSLGAKITSSAALSDGRLTSATTPAGFVFDVAATGTGPLVAPA